MRCTGKNKISEKKMGWQVKLNLISVFSSYFIQIFIRTGTYLQSEWHNLWLKSENKSFLLYNNKQLCWLGKKVSFQLKKKLNPNSTNRAKNHNTKISQTRSGQNTINYLNSNGILYSPIQQNLPWVMWVEPISANKSSSQNK